MSVEDRTAERRGEGRVGVATLTFVHRLSDGEAPMVRAQITDVSAEGVGLTSLIPLPAGQCVAVDVAREGVGHELLRCRVMHCGKSESGQFRIGVRVLERRPGSAAATRIPPEWLESH